jgi:hypothetical protein
VVAVVVGAEVAGVVGAEVAGVVEKLRAQGYVFNCLWFYSEWVVNI